MPLFIQSKILKHYNHFYSGLIVSQTLPSTVVSNFRYIDRRAHIKERCKEACQVLNIPNTAPLETFQLINIARCSISLDIKLSIKTLQNQITCKSIKLGILSE